MSEKELIDGQNDNPELKNNKSIKGWLKKIGVAGFLFFLIKGIVWIFIFVQAGKCALE